MTDTTLSDWLPIADAAARIGCSTRTVERLARAKQLEQRLRPQAGSPAVAVYNPDDVARLASERHPTPPPFVLDAGRAVGNGNGQDAQRGDRLQRVNSQLRTVGVDEQIRQLAIAFRTFLQSPPSPPVSEMAETLSPEERAAQYVTLREASAIKHLSQAYLRRAIEAKTLPAIRDRGWRIRRKDLEAL